MEIKTLFSTQFSKLNDFTRDLINIGEWFLYGISSTQYPDAKYYLSTGAMSFFLSEDGTVIAKTDRTPANLKFTSQVCFSDLPKTNEVIDMGLAWA